MAKAKFRGRVLPPGVFIRDDKWVVLRIMVKGKQVFIHIGHVDDPGVFKLAEAKRNEIKEQGRTNKLGLESKELRLRINQATEIFWNNYAKDKKHFRLNLDRINEVLGYNYLDDTTHLEISAMLKTVAATYKLCDSTIDKCHMVITRMFNFFYEWKEDKREYKNLAMPARNPGERIKMPSTDYRNRKRIVTSAEFELLQAHSRPGEDRILLGLMHSLLRQCDLRGLKKSVNIDKDRNCFIGLQKKTKRVFEPPITKHMWAIINSTPDDLIFPYFPVNFDSNMRDLYQRAGIPPIQPRDFRRSAARWLLKQGYDIEVVRQMLGHGKINTTQRYVGAQPHELQEAGNALANDFKWRPPQGAVIQCANCAKQPADRYAGHGLCVFCFSLTKRKWRPLRLSGEFALKFALWQKKAYGDVAKNDATVQLETQSIA